jgi:hypothetical protein
MFSKRDDKRSDERAGDLIAITLYTKQTETGFWTGIFKEKENIMRLQQEFTKAAVNRERKPPTVELTLFLVPLDKSEKNLESPEYLKVKNQMLGQAAQEFGPTVIIKDLLQEKLTDEEKSFLGHTASMGSVADFSKMRALIASQGRNCLQTDTNTCILDSSFQDLYDKTFLQGKDVFNASRCSDFYVAAHNKIIFLGSQSKLPAICETKLIDYCKGYHNNKNHLSDWCNGVYDFAFVESMYEIEATHRVVVPDTRSVDGNIFIYYPAKLTDERYQLMDNVIACQVESWRKTDKNTKEETKKLMALPGIEVDGVGKDFNYYHFKSIVKVFTNLPAWHLNENTVQDFKQRGRLKDFEGAEQARDIFVSKQNKTACLQILGAFYKYVQELKVSPEESTAMLKDLAMLIPDTKEGNALTKELFNCNVLALRNQGSVVQLNEFYLKKSDNILENEHKTYGSSSV